MTRIGHHVEEDGQICLAGGITDPDDVMTPLQAAAANSRIAQSPRAVQKVLSLQLALLRSGGNRESSAMSAIVEAGVQLSTSSIARNGVGD